MSVLPEEEAAGRAYDHRLMRRLLGYVRPYRAQVWLAGAVVLLDALAQLAGPLLTKEAIDRGIRRHDLVRLDQVAVLYLLVLLASFGLGYLQNQIMQRVGQRVMMDLRMAIFRQLQRLPLAFYDRNPVGRLMTRVTNDVDVLNELVTSGVLALFADVFALVGILVAMWRLNAELLGVAFSVVPLIFVVTLTFRIKVRRSFRDVRTRLARLNAFLNENLTGMSTVQLLNRQERNHAEFRAINAGHAEKFPELVRRYEQKLYNFGRRMCRNESDAEDLVQDTLLNVFRHLNDFRYETKFKNWLYRVAANTCLKKRRRSKFAPEPELSLDEVARPDEVETLEQVPEWARMPLDQLLNEELLETLNQAIWSLPEKYRIVVILRDVEEFSTEETAQILNLSPANVKVRLHRARLFLRDRLKGYFSHDV